MCTFLAYEEVPKVTEVESDSQVTETTETATDEAAAEPTELDKYWSAVNENPTDFTGWTYLLQYVEQEVTQLMFVD